jgi:hypothetical protein
MISLTSISIVLKISEEKKVAAFLAQQKRIRQEWDAIIARLSDATGTSALESTIKELTAHLKKYNTGIPIGVKKTDLVKLCRSKKFVPNTGKKVRYQPEWTTEVEIAYQVRLLIFFYFNDSSTI